VLRRTVTVVSIRRVYILLLTYLLTYFTYLHPQRQAKSSTLIRKLEKVEIAMHCNLKAAPRRASRCWLFFDQICNAHAQKLLFPE